MRVLVSDVEGRYKDSGDSIHVSALGSNELQFLCSSTARLLEFFSLTERTEKFDFYSRTVSLRLGIVNVGSLLWCVSPLYLRESFQL